MVEQNGTDIRIVEVGPRDGLQNEKAPVSVVDRINLVNRLSDAGFTKIETGSFVSAKWIPQMAESAAVFQGIERHSGVSYTSLTPNIQGFNDAVSARVDEVSVFGAASESFSQKNVNCSIAESFERMVPIMEQAGAINMPVRGYVSCAFDCPYEGAIRPEQPLVIAERLIEMGCFEIVLSDTTGKGTPASVKTLLELLLPSIPVNKVALHCHDTYGQGIANIYTALDMGVRVFDSSVAGLGGCPYAKGATGNVATEDLLFLLQGLGMNTGIDLEQTIDAGFFITELLNVPNRSKVAQAIRKSQ